MIDEKKIKEAAKKYAKEKESLCEKLADKYKSANSICSIVTINPDAAFKDGINWLKENLWHDASEEPKFDKDCLVELEVPNPKTGAYEARTYTISQYDYTFDSFGWSSEDIDNLLIEEHGRITRWLYIEDLMKGVK